MYDRYISKRGNSSHFIRCYAMCPKELGVTSVRVRLIHYALKFEDLSIML